MRQQYALTPEQVMEAGKMMAKQLVKTLPLEERLADLTPEERLAALKPKDLLEMLTPEDRLAGLSVQEIEQYLAILKQQSSSTTKMPQHKAS